MYLCAVSSPTLVVANPIFFHILPCSSLLMSCRARQAPAESYLALHGHHLPDHVAPAHMERTPGQTNRGMHISTAGGQLGQAAGMQTWYLASR